jgi:hypothetical protein
VKTIYGITSGSYSDYTVHCLFETEELAKKYIATMNENMLRAGDLNNGPGWTYGTGWDIEEFQFWDTLPVVSLETKPRYDGRPWLYVVSEAQ